MLSSDLPELWAFALNPPTCPSVGTTLLPESKLQKAKALLPHRIQQVGGEPHPTPCLQPPSAQCSARVQPGSIL